MKTIITIAVILSTLTTHSSASKACDYDEILGEYTCTGRCQRPGGTAYIYRSNDNNLWYENEVGGKSIGQRVNSDPDIYSAFAWGNLLGDVSYDCSIIRWRNDTIWTRK
jgi:hypothetical protein